MPKKDEIEVEGKVLEALPNAMFKVEIDEQHQVLAVLSGRIRMNFVRIVPGDKVKVQNSDGTQSNEVTYNPAP